MPYRVGKVLVTADKHAVIKHLQKRAILHSLPVSVNVLLEFDTHVVLPVRQRSIGRFTKTYHALFVVNGRVRVRLLGELHAVDLDHGSVVLVNILRVKVIIAITLKQRAVLVLLTVRQKGVDSIVRKHIHVLMNLAATARLPANRSSRNVALNRLDRCAVILQVRFTVHEVPNVFKNEAV